MRELLPDALEVRIERPGSATVRSPAADRHLRTPQTAFAAYLAANGIDDPRLGALFDELLAEELSTIGDG